MCTGLEIAALVGGTALSAGGSMMQANAAEKQAKAQAEARNNELKRTLGKNDALAKNSRDTFNKRAQDANAEKMQESQEENTQERQDTLETAVEQTPQAAAEVSLSGSAPTVVQSELAKRVGAAMQGSKDQAHRQGALAGYGDTWLDQGFKDVEAGRGIAQDANFAAGNMAILPYQQDFAEQRATKPISPIGGLLQGFGGMLSSYGGGGGALPKKTYKPSYGGGYI